MINVELGVGPDEVFSPAFLATVPPAQLNGLAAQLTAQFGRAVAVERLIPTSATEAVLEIRMEKAIGKGTIAINPADNDKIVGLLFTTFEPIDDSVSNIEADLSALPGSVNAYFAPLDGGDPVISMNADQPSALGSTIKLYVLAALGQEIAEGKRSWIDVIPLTAKSYPSGQMQDWPGGSPTTLHTLASMMISISDNTATDQLIAELGPKRVLKAMRDSDHSSPERNDPLLTTLNLFELKASGPDTVAAWRNGDRKARAELLDNLTNVGLSEAAVQAAFSAGPNALDIEWYASPRDLAKLFNFMRRNADSGVFPILEISPSVPAGVRSEWAYVGYKGGSEPGVLNLTWVLKDKAGKWHILTLGWNNPQGNVDETALELLAQRILSLPRE
jgi:beta-lactamase class A